MRTKGLLWLEHTIKIWEWLLSSKKSQMSSGTRNLPCFPHSCQTGPPDKMGSVTITPPR